MAKFHVWDTYIGPECSHCGSNAWMIDSNGPLLKQHHPQYWLLCMDVKLVGCIQTMDLPECVEIIDDMHSEMAETG